MFIENEPQKLGFSFKYKDQPMICLGVEYNIFQLTLGILNVNGTSSDEDNEYFRNLIRPYYSTDIDNPNEWWPISSRVEFKDVFNLLCNLTDKLIEESQKNKDIVL